jgi:hypothetical protein
MFRNQWKQIYIATLILLFAVASTSILQAQDQTSNNTAADSSQVKRIPIDINVSNKIAQQNASRKQTPNTAITGAVAASSGVPVNHGGWVITGQVHVYLIWYGNWSGNTATTIIPNFIAGLNGSSWENIMTTYNGRTGFATNQVTLAGQRFDSFSQGIHLDDTKTKAVMTSALGQFGTDNNGVYFILTSPGVQQTNGSDEFCVQYCGYHSDTVRSGIDVKYAFVGNPNRCVFYGYGDVCHGGASPNGNSDADSMTGVMSHELAEAITDPHPFDTWAPEVGDICSFIDNNISLPTGTFNVQAIWVNAGGGFCGFSH